MNAWENVYRLYRMKCIFSNLALENGQLPYNVKRETDERTSEREWYRSEGEWRRAHYFCVHTSLISSGEFAVSLFHSESGALSLSLVWMEVCFGCFRMGKSRVWGEQHMAYPKNSTEDKFRGWAGWNNVESNLQKKNLELSFFVFWQSRNLMRKSWRNIWLRSSYHK